MDNTPITIEESHINDYKTFENKFRDSEMIPDPAGSKLNSGLSFLAFSIIGAFALASKSLFLELSEISFLWLYTIQGIALLAFSTIGYVLTRLWSEKTFSEVMEYCIQPMFIKLLLITGVSNAVGYAFMMSALRHSLDADISPSLINSILMTNAILLVIYGIYVFNERHTLWEYFGGLILLIACVSISLCKSNYNDKDTSNISNSVLAIVFIICASLFFVIFIASVKHAAFHYGDIISHYIYLSLIVSSLCGCGAFFIIFMKGRLINAHEDKYKVWYISAGGLASFCFFIASVFIVKAVKLGSMGVLALFLNSHIFFKVILELCVFQMMPSLLTWLGMVCGIFGGLIMAYFQSNISH